MYNSNSIPSGYSLLYACDVMSCMCIVPLRLKEPKWFSKVPPTQHPKGVTAKHADSVLIWYEAKMVRCGPKGYAKPDHDVERIGGTYES